VELHELVHSLHEERKLLLTRLAGVQVEVPVGVALRLHPLLHLLRHHLLLLQPLVRDPRSKQLIEIEVVLHQEPHRRRLELKDCAGEELAHREDVEVEGPADVFVVVPVEGADPPLEGKHLLNGVLQLAVSVLH